MILELLGIAVGLAMDAFSVSLMTGMITSDFRVRHAVRLGATFGFFQFIMPVAGYFLGRTFAEKIEAYDHWVAFGLLALIGGKMLIDAARELHAGTVAGDSRRPAAETLAWRTLLIQGVATSIDALAVGVSFAMLSQNIWLSSGVIGAVTFALSFAGALLGKRAGNLLGRWARLFGGSVLVLIGVKILIEGLLA